MGIPTNNLEFKGKRLALTTQLTPDTEENVLKDNITLNYSLLLPQTVIYVRNKEKIFVLKACSNQSLLQFI